MNINEISKPVTAASLNESLAKRFGQKIAIEKFTLEQLQDARNKIRTKLSQVETNESFENVQNETYQKSKLFLDVLNAAISEREDISEANDCDKSCPKSCPDCGGTGDPKKYKEMKEAAKPDYIDIDGDGDKKEPMKKAVKDKEKKKKTDESVVTEGEEDKAELVMAAKDMVDRVTGWMEDTAEMQTESMLELADAIRDEHGSEKAEGFTGQVKPALEAMYAAMEDCRITLTQGVGMLTGENEAPMMGADPMADPAMEPSMDMDAEAGSLDLDADAPSLDAAPAAAGGEEEAGRARRESKVIKKKAMLERSRRLGTTLSKKK
jgi:hypothetical protein